MNVEDAKSFLISCGKAPTLDEDGRQEFHWSVEAGNLEEVRAWIAIGMSVDTQHDGSYPIVRAAEGNAPEMVELLCELGADLNVRDGDGDTALHTAVNWSHEEVLQTLIEKGSPLNTSNDVGETPLLSALESHEEFVPILLNAGADPNYGNNYGTCPLDAAIPSGFAEELLKRGADPNLVVDGQTVLGRLVMDDSDEGVRLLLEHGADPNKPNDHGWTATMIAHKNDASVSELFPSTDSPLVPLFRDIDALDTDSVKTAIEDLGPNVVDEYGRSLLIHVAGNGNESLVKLLIDAGADVNLELSDGENAISMAAGENHGTVMQMLFDAGANANNADGQCKALVDAALMSSVDATRILLDNGANPSSKNEYSDSALHQAIYEAPTELIQMLLEAGAETDCMNHIETSPLAYAVDQHRPDVVRLLIEHGADPNFADQHGKTALNEAVSMSFGYDKKLAECIDILLESGADGRAQYFGTTAYDNAVTYNYDDAAKQILTYETTTRLEQTRAEVDGSEDDVLSALAQKTDGYALQMWIRKDLNIAMKLLAFGAASEPTPDFSPLHTAIDTENDELVAAMLEMKLDPNGTGGYKQCVLSLAAEKGRLDWVNRLLELGAKPDGVGNYNPLESAASAGALDVVETLLTAGANPNPVVAGVSPLMRAAAEGHQEICEALIAAGASTEVKNRQGENASDWASSHGFESLAEILRP